jgi:two-component system, NtrC family, response regulator AtoC
MGIDDTSRRPSKQPFLRVAGAAMALNVQHLPNPQAGDVSIVISRGMRELYELAARAARTTLSILVLGETGSGKELLVRALHNLSPRADKPFKALNCAAIPPQLIESFLFGHERGAFTGADRQAAGIFEQARGGTVFLDEVAELAPQAQAALLRVLEQRRFLRVGGTRELEADVRVIAATHRDLPALVASGAFREDLMFRLDALSLHLPPLRERREEIEPLAELFLQRAREQWSASARRLSRNAITALTAYSWPGNVRQLKNVIERAVAVCTGDVIEPRDLPEPVRTSARLTHPNLSTSTVQSFASLPDRVRMFEIGLIRHAIDAARGNTARAARMLGLPRRTLANKIRVYGLDLVAVNGTEEVE